MMRSFIRRFGDFEGAARLSPCHRSMTMPTYSRKSRKLFAVVADIAGLICGVCRNQELIVSGRFDNAGRYHTARRQPVWHRRSAFADMTGL
ncbi:hypothetical protein [Rhizobium azibense]|uniref:hypothetical protein n=1 Tax=Rhizobium azibense TaxID=1136135 RepID=UPI001048FB91|nr:hypothetical protein [Rhizobium azibense]